MFNKTISTTYNKNAMKTKNYLKWKSKPNPKTESPEPIWFDFVFGLISRSLSVYDIIIYKNGIKYGFNREFFGF